MPPQRPKKDRVQENHACAFLSFVGLTSPDTDRYQPSAYSREFESAYRSRQHAIESPFPLTPTLPQPSPQRGPLLGEGADRAHSSFGDSHMTHKGIDETDGGNTWHDSIVARAA